MQNVNFITLSLRRQCILIMLPVITLMFKEDIVPEEADKYIFNVAPLLLVIPVFIIFSVIPFGISLYAVDINVSVLFILAITSISGLSIICAAWASANRIAIFSALRSVAMLISYEIPVGLSLVGILLICESMSVMDIVIYQKIPFILIQPVAAIVFFLGSLAEISLPLKESIMDWGCSNISFNIKCS